MQATAGRLAVMCSGAFIGTLLKVLPAFEQEARVAVGTTSGPSVGPSLRAIPARLRGGEACDLVILFEDAIDLLGAEGLLHPDTKVRIASSSIAVAVRRGASVPAVDSPEGLRRALLGARSFAYSASASGLYVSTVLLRRLGLPAEIGRKGSRIDGEPVGRVVARGEAEIGFQQLSELLPVDGITIAGPLPDGVQQVTVLAAAVASRAANPVAARALGAYLGSVRVQPALVEAGLSPIAPGPGTSVAT